MCGRIIRFVGILVNLAPMELSDPELRQESGLRKVLSISELNRNARALLEGSFPLLWIDGEISNLAQPASGHLYFSLKDDAAQVRGAMFRNRAIHLRFRPRNGMQVVVRARVSLYEPRGDFQLLVEHMEEAGAGALQRAFEALKQRLDQEGLFAAERKRALPSVPNCIGVITSPTGAAIHDILTVLKRRFPAIPVIIYPVPVQGEGAALQIAAMIRLASERNECDVLIIGRGGGSLEDLWAFNEEVVARAIHDSRLPIVSAVGHEIDFTIADFVADVRAPTPSAAAELTVPDGRELLQQLKEARQRLQHSVTERIRLARERLHWQQRRVLDPRKRLRDIAQRLDELELRLRRGWHHQMRHREAELRQLAARMRHATPAHRIRILLTKCRNVRNSLYSGMHHLLQSHRQQLQIQAGRLEAVSPLAVLGRGYSIIQKLPEGSIVRSSESVAPGDELEARLASGSIRCRVQETKNG